MNFKVSKYKVYDDCWGGYVLSIKSLKRKESVRKCNIKTETTFGDKTYTTGFISGEKGLIIAIFFPKSERIVSFDWSSDLAFVKDVEREAVEAEVNESCSWNEGYTGHYESWIDEKLTEILREEIRELSEELKKVFNVREIEFPYTPENEKYVCLQTNGELRNLDWSEVEVTPELLEWLALVDPDGTEFNVKRPEKEVVSKA